MSAICTSSATWADVGMMLAIFSPFFGFMILLYFLNRSLS